jgi:hypothetical protein
LDCASRNYWPRRTALFLAFLFLSILFGCNPNKAKASPETTTARPPADLAGILSIPESQDGISYRIDSDTPLYFPAANGQALVWSRGPQILVKSDQSSSPAVVYEIDDKSKPWQIMPTLIENNIVVWMEYYQTGESGALAWRVCWTTIGGSKDKVTLIDDLDDYAKPLPIFGISDGMIAYDRVVGSPPQRKATIEIYDTSRRAVIKTLTAEGVYSYFSPSISNGRVAFARLSRDAQSGVSKSELMLYSLSDDSLSILDLGSECVSPAIFNDTIVYNEVQPPSHIGTIYAYDTITRTKQRIWPDPQYLSSTEMQNVGAFGGITPTVNARYATWDTQFPVVICYDLKQKKLVRFPTSDRIVLRRKAFPNNVTWFGQQEGGGGFVAGRMLN